VTLYKFVLFPQPKQFLNWLSNLRRTFFRVGYGMECVYKIGKSFPLIMDRFLIAENPMNEDSNSAIIHTMDPISIIECMEGHVALEPGSVYKHFSFINLDEEAEEWTLRVHHLYPRELSGDEHSEQVDKLLNRAWKWFQSYMNWNDEQGDSLFG
jgi:hypothetical protein